MDKIPAPCPQLKCPEGNQGTHACANFQCQNPAITCSKQNCKCNTILHLSCATLTSLSKLKNQLQIKGRSYSIILQQIYKWYQNQMKLITIQMKQFKERIDKKQPFLFANENRLYRLFTGDHSEMILPQLISYVTKSIEKEPVMGNVEEKLEETRKQLESSDKQIKNIFEEVKMLTDTKLKSPDSDSFLLEDLKFSKELHHNNLTVADYNTIKVVTAGSVLTAFLEPAIPKNRYKSCKINFQVIKVSSNVMLFGVCQIPPNFKTKTSVDIHNSIEYGSLTSFSNTVYLGKSQCHKQEITNITAYANGDSIEMEYQMETQRVTIRNITKNTQSVSYIKTNKDLPIYFCVGLQHVNDSIQMIEGKCCQ